MWAFGRIASTAEALVLATIYRASQGMIEHASAPLANRATYAASVQGTGDEQTGSKSGRAAGSCLSGFDLEELLIRDTVGEKSTVWARVCFKSPNWCWPTLKIA